MSKNLDNLTKFLSLNVVIISSYGNEHTIPSLDVLVKLSYEFNASIEYLIGIEKNKTIDVSDLTDEQISAINNLIEIFRKK